MLLKVIDGIEARCHFSVIFIWFHHALIGTVETVQVPTAIKSIKNQSFRASPKGGATT